MNRSYLLFLSGATTVVAVGIAYLSIKRGENTKDKLIKECAKSLNMSYDDAKEYAENLQKMCEDEYRRL